MLTLFADTFNPLKSWLLFHIIFTKVMVEDGFMAPMAIFQLTFSSLCEFVSRCRISASVKKLLQVVVIAKLLMSSVFMLIERVNRFS